MNRENLFYQSISVYIVQDVVVGIQGRKVQLMYQHREKFSSLNSLMTSSGNHHRAPKLMYRFIWGLGSLFTVVKTDGTFPCKPVILWKLRTQRIIDKTSIKKDLQLIDLVTSPFFY